MVRPPPAAGFNSLPDTVVNDTPVKSKRKGDAGVRLRINPELREPDPGKFP
jgi:hypothetical protein